MTEGLRAGSGTGEAPFRIGVILLPGFSLMAFAATVEPLRSANLMRGETLYRWTHLSPGGGLVASSGGLEVRTTDLPSGGRMEYDLIILCGGLGCESYRNGRLTAFLRQATRHGLIVGSVSTASFILARSGLLDGRRCTLHWDYLPAFKESFPEIAVSSELFVIDRGIYTCAGGTAALDMMLQLIREHHGEALAKLISDQFIHGTLRQAREAQRMELGNRLGLSHPVAVKAVALMERSIAAPLPLGRIAEQLEISTRQLERLFRQSFGHTPAKHYLHLRLDKARKLLRLTTFSVLDVALACGFVSASHFAKTYRLHFGIVPTADRQIERSATVSSGTD